MPLKVGIVRDDRYLLHQTGLVHPERPARLKAIYSMLDRDFGKDLTCITPDPATLEQLELVHTPAYIRKILKTCEREFTNLSPDTPVSADSYLAAWLAVGGCIKGLQTLLSGRYDVCFCLARPPGHHALRDKAGGFCIFNNLGVAARYAIQRLGIRRILIVDWDIHHGNGLQNLFYEENEIMYISSHYTGWYPHTGNWDETGSGSGLGYTINLPVPKDIEDEDIVCLYWKVLSPAMKAYRPELILVAAGFDGHYRDPVGRTRLTENAYIWLTELLIELRDAVKSPPMLFALEGGYDATALTSSVKEVLKVLTYAGRRRRPSVSVASRGLALAEKALAIHNKYRIWTD